MKRINLILFALFPLIAFLFIACPTSDEPGQVLTLKITESNDSLLHFDSLIVTVHSKDSTFSQVVFHGVLRDANQVKGMPLDPRVGQDYTVTIVGYKNGKIGVNKEVTFVGNVSQSKDIPTKKDGPDTVIVTPNLPEILVPSDTSIAEGDSLRFRVTVRDPWSGTTTLTLKDILPGAALDTVGRDPGDGYFTWRPTFEQGRTEPYAVTFVYASTNQKVEKITHVKVINVNRPPKLVAIPDQKVKENESLTFKVEASDPDHDSLVLTASNLPTGASFSSGTFMWTPSEGQAGNYTVKFRAFDGSDSDLVSVLITVGNVDVPPPITVKITSPGQDTIVNVTPITILYTVNGIPLQKKFPLKDGKNRIRFDTTVQNRAGFDTILITFDTIPPAAPNVTGASPVRTRTPTWNWTSGGNGIGIYRYRLDSNDMSGSTVITETAYTASKDLDVGTHTLYVQEKDAAGNWSSSGMRAVRIDTTRPVAPPVTVSPSSPTNNTLPSWDWTPTGDDLSGLFRFKLDTNDLRSGAVETKAIHFVPAKDLNEGVHTLYVQQQDSAGNWSNSGSASVNIDLTPPGLPVLTPVQTSPTNNARPTWNIASGGGGASIFRAKMDDSNFTQGAKTGTLQSYTPDSALAHGLHRLFTQERDSAGNWSGTQSSAIFVDLIPPSAPKLDSTPESPLNSLQPYWTWKSGGGGMGLYRCKIDDSTFALTDTLRMTKFQATAPLTEGLHTLYVQERDTAGNWSAMGSRSITLALRGVVGGAGFSGAGAYTTSLALTRSGIPYVAFSDEANGYKASVMRLNSAGTGWEIVWKSGFSMGTANNTTLAINSLDVPYVAFTDGANGSKATVMRLSSAGIWETVGREGFSVNTANALSMAFSKTGVPYVAFQDGDTAKVTVMRLNAAGNAWEEVGGGRFSPSQADFPSLAFSKSDVPYVAFGDAANGDKATVMRLTSSGTAWEVVGGADFSSGQAISTSLAFSSNGIPYIVFGDEGNDSKATVMRLNASGTGWEVVGGAGISTGKITFASIVFNSAGAPYVAFEDWVNGFKATVMRLNSSATGWETLGGSGFSAGRADYLSLALNSKGVPYVAFSDGESGSKATVMKTSFDP